MSSTTKYKTGRWSKSDLEILTKVFTNTISIETATDEDIEKINSEYSFNRTVESIRKKVISLNIKFEGTKDNSVEKVEVDNKNKPNETQKKKTTTVKKNKTKSKSEAKTTKQKFLDSNKKEVVKEENKESIESVIDKLAKDKTKTVTEKIKEYNLHLEGYDESKSKVNHVLEDDIVHLFTTIYNKIKGLFKN